LPGFKELSSSHAPLIFAFYSTGQADYKSASRKFRIFGIFAYCGARITRNRNKAYLNIFLYPRLSFAFQSAWCWGLLVGEGTVLFFQGEKKNCKRDLDFVVRLQAKIQLTKKTEVSGMGCLLIPHP